MLSTIAKIMNVAMLPDSMNFVIFILENFFRINELPREIIG